MMRHHTKPWYGVQFHPEVTHSEFGKTLLSNFVLGICKVAPTWTPEHIFDDMVLSVNQQVAPNQHVLLGLSGGVDSMVLAVLLQRILGDRLHCVFVNTGLLRHFESTQLVGKFKELNLNVQVVDAGAEFLGALTGISDPEQKRKVIGRVFIEVFEREALKLNNISFLAQGTIYPDVIESAAAKFDTAHVIKSHHNVGGLPDDLDLELVEPLRDLFKDEVRAVGRELGLPEEIVARQPFPGPGLGIRIIGEVTADRLDTLRRADMIAREELSSAGLDGQIWQCPVVLLADIRSVGVQGDGRTYGHPVVLRPVSSEDAMTADWTRVPYDVLERISTRITNEVPEVNRVVLDVTSKPPGTIEWE